MKIKIIWLIAGTLLAFFFELSLMASSDPAGGVGSGAEELVTTQTQTEQVLEVPSVVARTSILGRIFAAGPVGLFVMLILIGMSIMSWAVLFSKWFYLRRIDRISCDFSKTFWNTRSLSDLNARLGEYPYSPMLEMFRSGYSELTRSGKLRDLKIPPELAVRGTLDNVARSLKKARLTERSCLDKYLVLLAVSASASPFIGLFGTVWGVMEAFEGIAMSGSTSLASVAPGISEALIATAFGLLAAIPAVVGYNLNAHKIRKICHNLDGFVLDFLNIVERHLIVERKVEKTSKVVENKMVGSEG